MVCIHAYKYICVYVCPCTCIYVCGCVLPSPLRPSEYKVHREPGNAFAVQSCSSCAAVDYAFSHKYSLIVPTCSELPECQGACAAVDYTFSHKYSLIVPTWAVLSQGTGEAVQVEPVCLG